MIHLVVIQGNIKEWGHPLLKGIVKHLQKMALTVEFHNLFFYYPFTQWPILKALPKYNGKVLVYNCRAFIRVITGE